MNDLEKLIGETVEKILYFIGVAASVDVVKSVESEDSKDEYYLVNLSGSDLGVIIGYHGESLAALQTTLGLMVSKQVGQWVPLIVDVNSYRKEREDKVRDMARGAVDKAKFLLKPVELPPMVAFERRLAHMEISKHAGVISESTGEGYNRRVVVKPE